MAKRAKRSAKLRLDLGFWFVTLSGPKKTEKTRQAILADAGLRPRYDFRSEREARAAARAIKEKTGVAMKVTQGGYLFW